MTRSFLNPYPAFTSNVPGFSAVTDSRGQLISVSNTTVINPSTVNELHLNYTRFAFLKNKPVGGLGPITDFGYVQGGLGINPVNPDTEGVAPISFGQLGMSFGLPDGTTGQYNNTYQISDNFSKVLGKHTLKFGGDVRYIQINERNTYTSNGWFEFDGGETGNDFADYLLGAPDLFNQTSHQLLDSRTKYFALYAQDAYKVRSDLTINYGLRWDVSQPFYDTQNRIQTFVPGVQSKIYPDSPTGICLPRRPGHTEHAGAHAIQPLRSTAGNCLFTVGHGGNRGEDLWWTWEDQHPDRRRALLHCHPGPESFR